ncbi:inosine triphosphate pyrophosphatase [Paecilomyces variotii No. 5]|uniref:Inosine triphosphate pyrophosphatase n=1 Tax=Byssochlamys spectabilis (strain No. 5 / NBRC 109023) TaxID=1356009 RepID=V5G1D8_BYSSN|nr:inosine triphosphate pyrophosphatase [Paecilomyces variotii No. 5]
MAPIKTLNFITGNKNKLSEVKAILGDTVELQNKAIDLPEIQGTSEDIAKEKCRRAAEIYVLTRLNTEKIGGPVLTEDTALEFHALKGLPGPYIKWFLEALGHEGLNKLVDPYDDKTCEAVCTFGFCKGPGAEPILFQGRTEGKVVRPRGPANFGWDPIFEYEGKTFAEMEKQEKNQISHRYKALLKLKEWLAEAKA